MSHLIGPNGSKSGSGAFGVVLSIPVVVPFSNPVIVVFSSLSVVEISTLSVGGFGTAFMVMFSIPTPIKKVSIDSNSAVVANEASSALALQRETLLEQQLKANKFYISFYDSLATLKF